MLLKEDETGAWLEFEQLQGLPIKHGISLVNSPYCHNTFCRRHGMETQFVSAKQVHGEQVHIVEKAQEGLIGDGLATKTPFLTLGVRHADCQASIFYDPVKHQMAVVHCGWKGSVQNIYKNAIASLKQLGSVPEDLLVCIGPSLGPESAEFIHYRTELPKDFWKFEVRPNYFDFWQISREQLMEEGVLPQHIEVAKEDTLPNATRFHSYRRNKSTERMTTASTLTF